MNSCSRKVHWIVWGSLLIIILAILSAFIRSKFSSGSALPVYGLLPDFILTNQTGQAVSLSNLKGQVWVADIIFTSCAGPCPQMTKLMSEIQADLSAGSTVNFVSLTADPDFDTPSVLKSYGARFNAQPDRWWFLTGEKKQIHRLAIDGLKLVLIEKKPEEREAPEDLFVHSTVMAVIDQRGRLRGTFESTEPDARQRIREAVKQLEREK